MNNQSVLPVALGGTGATTAANARSNLGALSSANGAVARAKLANDALYSPIVLVSSNRNIAASDLGKTLVANYSSTSATRVLTINATVSAALPVGFECAICRMWKYSECKLTFSGCRVTFEGAQNINKADTKTLVLPDLGTMIALKKIETNASVGDVWLLTGPVEIA